MHQQTARANIYLKKESILIQYDWTTIENCISYISLKNLKTLFTPCSPVEGINTMVALIWEECV
jgi:hypothetical protein